MAHRRDAVRPTAYSGVVRSQKKDLAVAFTALAVGLACVLGAWAAIHDDNKFLAVILCVFGLAAGGMSFAVVVRNVRSMR